MRTGGLVRQVHLRRETRGAWRVEEPPAALARGVEGVVQLGDVEDEAVERALLLEHLRDAGAAGRAHHAPIRRCAEEASRTLGRIGGRGGAGVWESLGAVESV